MTIANQIISFKLSGINYTGTSTQLNYTSGVTAGICLESKALIVNENKNISGINSLSATSLTASTLTGTLQTASQTNITSVGTLSSLTVNGNVNVQGHNGTTTGLSLNGALVLVSANELNVLASITAGTAASGKALVLNSSRNITNINSISSNDIVVSNNFSYRGTVISISGENLNYVDVVAGTAAAGKALVVDSSRNIVNVNSITSANLLATNLTGTLATAAQPNVTSIGTLTSLNLAGSISNAVNITMSGTISGGSSISATNLTGTITTAAQPNITSVGTLTVVNSSGRVTAPTATIGALTLGSTVVDASASDLNKIGGITNGTASADRALVVNSSRDIVNINSISCANITATTFTGTISTTAQPNITSTGILSSLEVNGNSIVRINNNTSTFSTYGSWINSLTTPINCRLELDNSQIRFGSASNHSIRFMSNNSTVLSIENTGNVSIGTQALTSYRLNISGSLNCSSFFIGESQVLSTGTEINYLSGISLGSASASKALVLDSSRNIGNIASLTATSLSATNITGTISTASQPNITSLGELTSLTLNSAGVGLIVRNLNTAAAASFRLQNDLRNIEIGLRGSTSSTNANMMYILDGSSTRMVMDSSGNFTFGGNTNTGSHRVNVVGGINCTSFFIDGNQVNATSSEINNLAGVTAGTASSSKALVLDSNGDITGIRNLSTSGTISSVILTAAQPNITSLGTLTSLTLSGNISGVSNLVMTGSLSGATSLSATTLIGALSTASQPNITSVGTLSGLLSSGNVKVGTVSSSASDLIHIEGNNSTGLGLQIENRNNVSDSLSYIKFTGFNSSNDNYDLASIACGYVNANANFGYGYLAFSTRNNSSASLSTERMRITQDGNVGIGKISPAHMLDVDGTINCTQLRLGNSPINATVSEINVLAGSVAGTASSGKALVVNSTLDIGNVRNMSLTSILTVNRATSGTSFRSINGSSDCALYHFNEGDVYFGPTSNHSLIFQSNNTARMIINASGSVTGISSLTATSLTGTLQTASQPNITSLGILSSCTVTNAIKIGTTANSANDFLHIEHNSAATVGIQLENVNTTANSGTHIKFNGFHSTNSDYDLARISCGYVSGGASFGFGYLAFSTRDNSTNSTSSERMRITQNGRVGIGNTNPTYNLDVAGTGRVGQLLVGTSTDTSSSRIISALNSSMTVDSDIYICLGRENSSRNQGEINFHYWGAGSVYNSVTIGTHSQAYRTSFGANGYVGIGIEYPQNNLNVNQIGSNSCIRIDRDTAVSTANFIDLGITTSNRFFVGGGALFSSTNSDSSSAYVFINGTTNISVSNYGFITSTGSTGSNGTSGTFGCSLRTSGRIVSGTEINILSDRRIKKDIVNISDEYCRDFVYNVSSKKYIYKKDVSGKVNVGFVAQDVLKAGYEELIGFAEEEGVREELDDDGFLNPEGQIFTVNYEAVVPILSQNIKNLFEENKKMVEENKELKKELTELKELVKNLCEYMKSST
jgi:Chaperone of endosialidase